MIGLWALDRRHPIYFHQHQFVSPLPRRRIHLHQPIAPTLRYDICCPTDLPKAIKHLSDHELDRLLAAALAEQKRRRKLPASDEISRKRKAEVITAPLTQGKLNAVRAAFKAGITSSRIARQFGISQSDVRKALADHLSKR